MTLIERPAVCTLDCPDTCSLTVSVGANRIVKVRGSQALPYTEGVICNKVAHHTGEFVHGSGRLVAPLMRVGPRGSDRFERVSWQRALDIIHARVSAVMDRWGTQAVMPLNYAGPHGMLAYDSMSLRFFHKLGATQLYRGAMCGMVRSGSITTSLPLRRLDTRIWRTRCRLVTVALLPQTMLSFAAPAASGEMPGTEP